MTERIAILGAGDLGRTLARQLGTHPGQSAVAFYDDVHAGGRAATASMHGKRRSMSYVVSAAMRAST